MQFKDVTQESLTEFFLSEPNLVLLGMPDEEMIYLHENKQYTCTSGSSFVEITDDDGTSLGVVRWEFFTQISIVIHMYLRHKYHHGKELKRIYDFIYNHLRDNTKVRKVVAFAASTCKHVIGAVEKYGFTKSGSIPKCLIWRQEVVGLEIYSLDIEEKGE